MKTFGASKEFVQDQDLEWETVGKGVKRKIMTYDDKIMLVKVHFDEGGIGYKHEHYHSQVTYIESGEFEFSLDNYRPNRITFAGPTRLETVESGDQEEEAEEDSGSDGEGISKEENEEDEDMVEELEPPRREGQKQRVYRQSIRKTISAF